MNSKKTNWAGQHFILEFWQCRYLNSTKIIQEALEEAVKACGAELLSIDVHQFEPQGVSGVAVIKESHISVHTWPEEKYAALDIFTCGQKVKPYLAIEKLKEYFNPKHFNIMEIKRGLK